MYEHMRGLHLHAQGLPLARLNLVRLDNEFMRDGQVERTQQT